MEVQAWVELYRSAERNLRVSGLQSNARRRDHWQSKSVVIQASSSQQQIRNHVDFERFINGLAGHTMLSKKSNEARLHSDDVGLDKGLSRAGAKSLHFSLTDMENARELGFMCIGL